MERYEIAKPIQQIILDYREEKGLSYRDFLTPELPHTALNNIQTADDKFIQLDTLDKIFNKHPELAERIARHFSSYLKENNTAATNEAAVYKREAEKFRKAADALARVNLINAQTIAELTGSEVVE